jgi:hypothetical protein
MSDSEQDDSTKSDYALCRIRDSAVCKSAESYTAVGYKQPRITFPAVDPNAGNHTLRSVLHAYSRSPLWAKAGNHIPRSVLQRRIIYPAASHISHSGITAQNQVPRCELHTVAGSKLSVSRFAKCSIWLEARGQSSCNPHNSKGGYEQTLDVAGGAGDTKKRR